MPDNKTLEEILYLSACALHNLAPEPERLISVDFAKLYQECRRHAMTAIVCMALEDGGAMNEEVMPALLVKRWQEEKYKALRKNMMLDAARKKLFDYMDRRGIWHMPLKGIVLKELYPQPGMRQMADNDILFDAAKQREVEEYMVGQGYEAVSVGKGNHDIYAKPPAYNFELHTALYGVVHKEVWRRYYENVKDRLKKDAGANSGYHFSEEDFYLYITTHAFKHYDAGGTGLRCLMDCYVYIQRMGERMDWDYVEAESVKLGIVDFEKRIRELSRKLFSDPAHFHEIYERKLSQEEREMVLYLYDSGTYGTLHHKVRNKLAALQEDAGPIRKKTKWNYYRRRLFPDADWYRQYHPLVYRHKWLMPFFFVYRIFRGAALRRRVIQEEIQAVENADKK